MSVVLVCYALIGAAIFGWLLCEHVAARSRIDKVPLHIFVLMPLLWGPVAAASILLFAGLWAVSAWRGAGR